MKRPAAEQEHLGGGTIMVLLALAVVWGASMAVVKIGAAEMAPIFMAAARSGLAALCLLAWMMFKGIKPFPGLNITLHGTVLGLLFAAEFACIYVGLTLTLASRVFILVYTAPFFVALGAHLFLKGDRLTWRKFSGLALAFAGVVILFVRDWEDALGGSLTGDLLALAGGALWAATTLYLKRFLSDRTQPQQTLFFQLAFSAPLLLGLSLLIEDRLVFGFGWVGAASLLYQSVVVAFLSYLAWFTLIHRYPASLLHAFSSVTPLVGVLISGVLILGEPVGLRLIIALVLVSLGLVQVNR